jgi:hypothetical protein
MLVKSPRSAAAPNDAVRKAFRHFKIDPNEPGAGDRLIELMAQEFFGHSKRYRWWRRRSLRSATCAW